MTAESIAFIAGATGYTGREVVRALRARGARAVAHVRPDSSRLAEWRARFEEQGAEVDATPWDEAAMTATFARLRPTVIFALLGTTKSRARAAKKRGEDAAQQSYQAVDYGLSAILLRAAQASGARPRFVYLSAMGVSDSAAGEYMAVRARLERELRGSGLPFTIVRPSFITSGEHARDEERPMESLGASVGDALLGAVALFGAKKLRDRYASIDPATLGEALVKFGLGAEGEDRVLEADALR